MPKDTAEQLSNQLIVIVKKMEIGFTLKGRPIGLEEVFSESGLLPGLARRADQLCSLCFGYGLGITCDDKEQTLLGVTVSFDEFTPHVLRLFCIVDAICELVKTSPSIKEVALDELMYD